MEDEHQITADSDPAAEYARWKAEIIAAGGVGDELSLADFEHLIAELRRDREG